ncbi:hypothetical protein AB7008_15215 [Bradyrhizobium sp. 521_C7_N1_3]|uniref:hypothetical protein n=1 Tax=Bradyrhizobium sp. 521_C7_N1_3 TaxID=3240368 RepID=UPI003F8B4D27
MAASILRLFLVLLFLMPACWGSAFAQSCREATIQHPVPFMGNNDEVFRLDDGSIWKVQYEYEYLYEYYPRVMVCAGQGKLVIGKKVLSVVELFSGPPSRRSGPAPAPMRTPNQIIVVAAQSGCRDYFVADGPTGFYLLEWYGGYSPSAGDIILGDMSGYGFKDVLYQRNGASGRVYVDDYMLSRARAIEKYAEKCN